MSGAVPKKLYLHDPSLCAVYHRLFTALHFLIFLFAHWMHGYNPKRTGYQHKNHCFPHSLTFVLLCCFKPCLNRKCLVTKHNQTLFGNQTFSYLDTLPYLIVFDKIWALTNISIHFVWTVIKPPLHDCCRLYIFWRGKENYFLV